MHYFLFGGHSVACMGLDPPIKISLLCASCCSFLDVNGDQRWWDDCTTISLT